MKTVILYGTLLFSLHLQGQMSFRNDTIHIKEVEIKPKIAGREYTGFKTTFLDSSIIGNYNHRTVADLIAQNSMIYIKTYGSDGLATTSFRGTGPSHTQISWNKINLNNPMVGQSDLSLVPAGLIDDINILYGGGSMNINSGGFGGVIDLETKPDWNDKNMIYINPGVGSFGRLSGLAKITTGNTGFQSVTKAFFKNSENNFRYLNSVLSQIPFWETRKNSQVSQKGFIQELYFKNSGNTYSARLWYQSATRNLPVPITAQTINPPEKQYDESLRTMITYEHLKGTTNLLITGAFISDKIEYIHKLASIDSRNSSNRIILKSDLDSRVNELLKIKIAFNNELNIVNTNNYAEKKFRNVASFDGIAETDPAKWLAARLLVREIIHDSKFLSPDFSAGTEIRPFRHKYYFVKASFSKNSKIPSLNDMYWLPGGNPDLKNEIGYLSEITWEMTSLLSDNLSIKNDLTFFRNHFNNMIQWHPGDFSYWKADNLNELITSGLESSLDIIYKALEFNARLKASYSLTRATSVGLNVNNHESSRRQAMYIPANQINALLKLNRRNAYSTLIYNYTGKRYLDADNTQYLPQYSIFDMNLGIKLNATNTSCDIGFFIENLFNASYQNIAYYPMPGRSYLVSVVFQLKK